MCGVCVKEALHIITSSKGLSHPNPLGCASSLFSREKQTENAHADAGDFFKETLLCFYSIVSSSGELLTSCLGSMKHHFDYREPFQDDLQHQNHQHQQRNLFWFPFSVWSHVCCCPSHPSAQHTGGWAGGWKSVWFICSAESEVWHRWFAVFPTSSCWECVQTGKGHYLVLCTRQ